MQLIGSGSVGQIGMVTICGSIGPICGSLITVAFRLGFRLVLRLGLRIVVYKLLEKVAKCRSVA